MEIKTITKAVCLRCSYEWWPTRELSEVKICPRCKSKVWNKPRENRMGLKDGSLTSIHEIRQQSKEKDE